MTAAASRPSELPLAVASHATSKIADADDLFRVGTFGFRGEALASIAEVSQLRHPQPARPKPRRAHELEVVGGVRRDVAPCGCPVGTTIEVRNLFYNTPVRRKFLRASQTEIGHCSEAFTRIALAQPQIHFTLRHNDKLLFDLPPTAELAGADRGVLWPRSGEHADPARQPRRRRAAVRLRRRSASTAGRTTALQYLLLNGRFIRDRSLQHALGRGVSRAAAWRAAFRSPSCGWRCRPRRSM